MPTFACQFKLRRIFKHHLMLRPAGGNHRIAVLVRVGMNIHQHRAFMFQAFFEHRLDFAGFERAQSDDAVGVRQV